jgi:DNA mismatch endonuclease (patch repair protein)
MQSARFEGGQSMVDSIDAKARSALMSRVRAKDTLPELVVRKLVFANGFRYRLHVRNLPGSPDLVFPTRKKVIFVHGCFWHQHEGCRRARIPKSNVDFWKVKFGKNKSRDEQTIRSLAELGWATLVLWECQVNDLVTLKSTINEFLA